MNDNPSHKMVVLTSDHTAECSCGGFHPIDAAGQMVVWFRWVRRSENPAIARRQRLEEFEQEARDNRYNW